MTTKTADGKGRMTFGKAFANSPVLIKRISEPEVRVVKARVIPEDEAWLWENDQAIQGVRRGLAQTAKGHLVELPNLETDAAQ